MVGIGKCIWAAFLEADLICECKRGKQGRETGEGGKHPCFPIAVPSPGRPI